jgi:RecJ-like exonuclease
LNIFLDIGSGQLGELSARFKDRLVLVMDHHPPSGRRRRGILQINPHVLGLDGSTEISGSGLAYLLYRKMKGDRALARIAVIGAVADRQDLLGELQGMNREILNDALGTGSVREEKDVLLFGRESRPLHLALTSFQDPPIPGVSGSEVGAMQLLGDLRIPMRDGRGFRTLRDLDQEERRRLASELVVRCIARASPMVARYVPKLIIGSVYRMVGEPYPLEYASEYATCVNAAVRMGLATEAIEMMLGDRSASYGKVMSGLRDYRGIISREVRRVSANGVKSAREGYLQYFVSEETPRNLIGPVTGLLLGGGLADPYRPLIGLVPGHKTKVSARCSKILVLEGLDLSTSVKKAAAKVGGQGGGHRGAAGAFFEGGREAEFLKGMESYVLAQVKPARLPRSTP